MPYRDPEAKKQYQRDYYNGREPAYRRSIYSNVKARRAVLRKIIAEAKEGRHCACGEGHPACLDFHHRGTDKVMGISEIPNAGWSRDRLLEEIAKCDLMCANCHRKHHFDGP